MHLDYLLLTYSYMQQQLQLGTIESTQYLHQHKKPCTKIIVTYVANIIILKLRLKYHYGIFNIRSTLTIPRDPLQTSRQGYFCWNSFFHVDNLTLNSDTLPIIKLYALPELVKSNKFRG